ncbi:signal transduction histidine kinase [Desulfocapsa sulfexigens DSM 10523]|uniref:histidine kinase n=1 Tax=Desulfocapsa sulfexigens (strain DSM 10523 / SB164P1) TaxID=1167006 RepID=M1P5Z9_DESSD|nr:response regulator [Desulfocapsa sulfexigens]AGF77112.1 signal transduction histidine kinase [Desulfocapsa sulfexigens DSM 10523]
MSEKSKNKEDHFAFTLRRGLGKNIFVSFMVLALMPLLVASVLSYHNAHTSLLTKEVRNLQTALSLRGLYFEAYFQERLDDLALQADLSDNIFLLQDLKESYNKSGLSLSQFVKSYNHTRIVTEHSQDLQDFQERAGYSNIYMIDIAGDILFSITAEEDLGTNIFHGPYHETELAKLCRLAIETGHSLASDLTIYGPSGTEKTLFTAQLMVNDYGEEIGVLVLQIELKKIDTLMADVSGLGKTGQIFVVGNDSTLRSTLRSDRTKQVLSTDVNNPLVTKWLQREVIRHGVGHEEARKHLLLGDFEGSIYKGQSGNNVLGISADMDSLGQYDMHWLMIAEVDEAEVLEAASNLQHMLILVVSFTTLFIVFLAAFLARRMIMPLVSLSAWAKQVSTGDLSIHEMHPPSNEIGTLYQALSDMVGELREMIDVKDREDWFKTGETGLDKEMRGEGNIATLGDKILNYLCRYLELPVGVFFAYENETLKFTAGYAYKKQTEDDDIVFALGEGLIGQAARDKRKIYLREGAAEEAHLKTTSGLGIVNLRSLLIIPLVRDDNILGVLEFGSNRILTEEEINFLEHVSESTAIAFQSSNSRQQLQVLLKQTQEQTEQLQTQQQILEERNKKIELSSKYKSEFLANMSHELRTPLNSILLLSSLMADNKHNALSKDDVESVKIINKAGNDLLNLINEVLDLAKVESGHMTIEIDDVQIVELAQHMKHLFYPVCEDKAIDFKVTLDENMPDTFRTDQSRLEQILKNFLSNSCKFTKNGKVSLHIGRVATLHPDLASSTPEEFMSPENLAFTVTDSGIGIAKEKQDLIFESFQQADGSTCRQYGGTGLGLSISLEMAKLLGGCIVMTSEPGQGSQFSLIVPTEQNNEDNDSHGRITAIPSNQRTTLPVTEKVVTQKSADNVADDRKNILNDDLVLLIIDDDPDFATIVRDVARKQQFKVLVAESGEIGLQLIELYNITAITLDIGLPGMSGWTVLSRLKEDSSTRHIPVHVISASDHDNEALKMGALNFVTKPIDAEVLIDALVQLRDMASARGKKVLLVEDDNTLSQVLKNFIMADDIEFLRASTGAQALTILRESTPDCVILDLGLPDMGGEELLRIINDVEELQKIPIIVYTGQDLTSQQKALLDQYSRTTILKGPLSHERLLAEITLFMHRAEKDLPPQQQEIVQRFYNKEHVFKGRKILLVDDDMRNVFSLRKILSDKDLDVVVGKNGMEALEQLKKNDDIDLVLMDIMMPVMDGFEAMAKIRKEKKFKNLPIIAITAKAMKGDRKKCIDGGANDYLAKPIDTERLFAMLRVWLHDRESNTNI